MHHAISPHSVLASVAPPKIRITAARSLTLPDRLAHSSLPVRILATDLRATDDEERDELPRPGSGLNEYYHGFIGDVFCA
jgi:hypothetical protein